MPFSAIGPDQKPTNPAPYTHTTYVDSQEASRKIVASQKSWLSRKEVTAERLRNESNNDHSLAAGRLREIGSSGRPDRKWTSQRPNAHFAWDYVEDTFLNAEAHQEAVDVLDAWKFAPWKGAIYRGLFFKEETTYSGHWEPLTDQVTSLAVDAAPAPYAPYTGPLITAGLSKAGVNKAYDTYLLDKDKESALVALQVAVASHAPEGRRLSEANNLLNTGGAEIDMEAEDIISLFVVDLLRRFGKGQYTQEHPFHTWIGFIWKTYFFPEMQTKVLKYLKQTTFMNPNDHDDVDYAHENHSVLQSSVELQMAKREAEGYALPLPEGHDLGQLDDPENPLSEVSERTKAILRALATGCTKKEAAKLAGVSERQGRRLMDKALPASCTSEMEVSL